MSRENIIANSSQESVDPKVKKRAYDVALHHPSATALPIRTRFFIGEAATNVLSTQKDITELVIDTDKAAQDSPFGRREQTNLGNVASKRFTAYEGYKGKGNSPEKAFSLSENDALVEIAVRETRQRLAEDIDLQSPRVGEESMADGERYVRVFAERYDVHLATAVTRSTVTQLLAENYRNPQNK